MTKITNKYGHVFDADAVAILMDDDIREDLADQGFESEQAFFDAYCEIDTDFEFNKPNPQV